VEGYILYQLLFGADLTRARDAEPLALTADAGGHGSVTAAAAARLSPPAAVLRHALAHALAFVIWQAGAVKEKVGGPAGAAAVEHKGALVTAATRSALPATPTTPAESLAVAYFTRFDALQAAVLEALDQFETESGVVLLMLSILMARGVDVAKVCGCGCGCGCGCACACACGCAGDAAGACTLLPQAPTHCAGVVRGGRRRSFDTSSQWPQRCPAHCFARVHRSCLTVTLRCCGRRCG
jgi:hypothetical protein